MASPPLVEALALKSLQAWDRLRLRRVLWRNPGLAIEPGASTNLASAWFDLAPGAELRIGAGVVTERRSGALRFLLGPGARVEIGAGSWLRTDVDRVVIAAGPDARIHIGEHCFLNGCHLSARQSIEVGRRSMLGFGSRLLDSDLHELDAERGEQVAPIALGDHVWVAADATVLRGVRIGDHAVIGARSLVTRDVPAHTLAFGNPATPRGPVGDRSQSR